MATDAPDPGEKHKETQRPSGLRRLSLAMLATDRTAADFTGLSNEAGGPGMVLGAFKAAAPYLGLPGRVVQAVDWLFRFTQAQDWAPGSRPIVWPSAATQQAELGLGVTQAKALNRYLVELGLVVMRDSPNGKRYGKRDRAGRIIEAYGFDLSPLATRLEEFRAVAERGRAEREAVRHWRRRATIARKAIAQIVETASELGLADAGLEREGEEARRLAWRLAKLEHPDALALGVAQLERRQELVRTRLEALLAAKKEGDSDPKGPADRPHQYTYKSPLNPEQDTVIRIGECKSGPVLDGSSTVGAVPMAAPPAGQGRGTRQAGRQDRGTVLRITPDELVRMAPRLRPYLAHGSPRWGEIVEAADWLRHDLGVSKPLWGEACLAMGRERAAIALAIVSAKPEGHFRGSPGGYFHGMVTKARAGELHLDRTLWGMRSGGAKAGGPERAGPRRESPHAP